MCCRVEGEELVEHRRERDCQHDQCFDRVGANCAEVDTIHDPGHQHHTKLDRCQPRAELNESQHGAYDDKAESSDCDLEAKICRKRSAISIIFTNLR